jgi:hypothetical protein
MNGSRIQPLARGGRRMRELATVYESSRLELEADILREIGRAPTTLDRVAVEALSSAVIGARRKRAAGQHDSEQLKLVAQLMRASGLRPGPASAPTPLTIAQQLALRGYQPPASEQDESDLAETNEEAAE